MTKRQLRIRGRDLDLANWIYNYIRENGYSPTIREMQAFLGLASPSSAHAAFQRLLALELVTVRGKARRPLFVDYNKLMEHDDD